MNTNQDPSQQTSGKTGRRRQYATVGGSAVATAVAIGLVFGVYRIGGGDQVYETPPPTAVSPDAAGADDEDVVVDDSVREIVDEVLREDDVEYPDGDPTTDPVGVDAASATPDPVGLGSLCVNVVHGDASSGIWVRGEVYGLDSGWIFVQAETVNGGEPVQVPVDSGAFDSPLSIGQYGDHEITRFELVPEGPGAIPVDLMPALLDGPGAVFPVGPDDGPIFDSECFDIEPPAPVDVAADAPVADAPAASEAALVEEFLDGFVEDHRTGDVAGLLSTLHPAIPLSFGEDVCTDYVERTTGSIADATVVGVGQVGPFELDTANGPIGFPEAIPFTVVFTLTDGGSTTNEAHLPLHNGTVHWLTTCGVDVP